MTKFKPIRILLYTLSMAMPLAACNVNGAADAQTEQPPAKQGRADTRALRNADSVGYDGAVVQKKLDAALDANDRHTDELDAQIDAAEPATDDR